MHLTRSVVAKGVGLVAGLSLAVIGLGPAGSAATEGDLAPLLGTDRAGVVPGEYIVVLEQGADAEAAATAARSAGGSVDAVYSHAIQGYSATLSADALAAVRASDQVKYVEANLVVDFPDLQVGDGSQDGATWGIDRSDQRSLPLNQKYKWKRTGKGVNAYIIDSGMRISHDDYQGRAEWGWDVVGDDLEGPDCFGHGTHVGGTVGGKTYGIAKKVRIVTINTCFGSGQTSAAYVIEAVDWVVENGEGPAVVNMSLGFQLGSGVADAVDAAIKETGFTFSVSAGNGGADACRNEPAAVKAAITVAASDINDVEAAFSDAGPCVDIYAPGVSILSLSHTSDTGTRVMSGTSMSAPHVTGAAALYLEAHPNASPAKVAKALVKKSTKGELTGLGAGSPNALLYTLWKK